MNQTFTPDRTDLKEHLLENVAAGQEAQAAIDARTAEENRARAGVEAAQNLQRIAQMEAQERKVEELRPKIVAALERLKPITTAQRARIEAVWAELKALREELPRTQREIANLQAQARRELMYLEEFRHVRSGELYAKFWAECGGRDPALTAAPEGLGADIPVNCVNTIRRMHFYRAERGQ